MTWSLSTQPEAIGVAATLIEGTAGIPAAHVEKDFWVTEVLRAAVSQAEKDGVTLVFKGGTSLSKAHGLIRRFSEDVDLIVVAPTDSKQAADRCLKAIGEAVGFALGVEGKVDARTATTGLKRTLRFEYRANHDQGNLRRQVLLELGARGGTLPMDWLRVNSLIAEHGPSVGIETDFEESAAFNTWVLNPTRTLVEKLMILHHAAETDDKQERIRLVRHYYDIWCLLNHEPTVRGFTDWPCDALAKEVHVHTGHAGLKSTPRPTAGFASSRAFTEPTRAVREAFESQVLDQLVWGAPDDKPSLDDCCDLVEALRDKL